MKSFKHIFVMALMVGQRTLSMVWHYSRQCGATDDIWGIADMKVLRMVELGQHVLQYLKRLMC